MSDFDVDCAANQVYERARVLHVPPGLLRLLFSRA
jgi:hypothetical protein